MTIIPEEVHDTMRDFRTQSRSATGQGCGRFQSDVLCKVKFEVIAKPTGLNEVHADWGMEATDTPGARAIA